MSEPQPVMKIEVFQEDDGRWAAEYTSGQAAVMSPYSDNPLAALAKLLALLLEVDWYKSQEQVSALIRERDALREQIQACDPYLKEGELPVERMERDHRDAVAMIGLLAKEKFRAEKAEAERDVLLQRVQQLEQQKEAAQPSALDVFGEFVSAGRINAVTGDVES